jgi:exodeoxyribonuclease V alpha subunit
MNATDATELHAAGAALMRQLQACAAQGSLRRLDVAFARFVLGMAPQSDPALPIAAALLAHLEGQGHACMPIEQLPAQAAALLAGLAGQGSVPPSSLAALPHDAAGWSRVLSTCALIDTEPDTAPDVTTHDDDTGEGDARSSTPLVLHGGRLYLRRYWRHEQRVAQQVRLRCQQAHPVDIAAARAALERLFAPTTIDEELDWQRIACALALRAGLTVITGGPGTGKTHTAARALALLLMQPRRDETGSDRPLRVALAAPTGKAAARLGQSIAAAWPALLQQAAVNEALAQALAADLARIGPARTLHALLGARRHTRKFRYDASNRLPLDVLIVDEASMVHLEMMDALLAALPDNARLVLLGDKDQLASVEAGAVLGELCRGAGQGRYDDATAQYLDAVSGQRLADAMVQGGSVLDQQTAVLRHSHRFGGAIHKLAAAVNAGDVAATTALLQAGNDPAIAWRRSGSARDVLPLALHGRDDTAGGYAGYAELLQRRAARSPGEGGAIDNAWLLELLRAFDKVRVLCAVHDGEWGTQALNAAIEQALADSGAIHRQGEWYDGRAVMVTRNDADAGVFNGDIGIVLATGHGAGTCRAHFFNGTTLRSVAVGRLPPVQTAFALTVHKAQGSEFEHAVLVLPAPPSRVASRELVYTAVTRARAAFTLVTGQDEALAEALARRTLRFSGLAERIGRTMD